MFVCAKALNGLSVSIYNILKLLKNYLGEQNNRRTTEKENG